MENAIFHLPSDQEQMVWLIDFHGFNLSHISVKVTRETAQVLQNQYPERLGVAILYNPPKFFEPFWTVVKPFLEPKTVNKVKFVYSDNPNSIKIMEDVFDINQIESSFGGNTDAGFDINKYAERMKEDDKKRMPSLISENTPVAALETTTSVDTANSESDSDTSGEKASKLSRDVSAEDLAPNGNLQVNNSGSRETGDLN